ncbi:bacterioferritin [Algimonas ampicilliniresistens]|jgi:bacterioferritin|uniref:Bacterioferritin n=1 Tax=Algimonas ampicilliniresistens TaxID=1298735 RepID=A0ABQ5VCP8_9PROT|nr:bacterioferritin [Algimonas ampicilliniresistens]GLQ24470.1 bacterioferritin [Algimonas ampicilliniresistens]
MKSDPEVIVWLNRALKAELTAINQYFLHSRMLKDWGVTRLAKKEYEESIEEMNHADDIIERILFLGGLPNLQDLGKLRIGETVQEILECDMSLEEMAIPMYKDAIHHCESVRDYVTRDMLQKILVEEEEHVDFLETQFDLIKQIGIERYIKLQSTPADEAG